MKKEIIQIQLYVDLFTGQHYYTALFTNDWRLADPCKRAPGITRSNLPFFSRTAAAAAHSQN